MAGGSGVEAATRPSSLFSGWTPPPHPTPGVEVGKPTHFTVLTKGAGKAKLDVHFAGAAKGEAVKDFEIIDNHDYSYTVKYTAVQQVCPGPAWGSGCPSSNLSWSLAPACLPSSLQESLLEGPLSPRGLL